MLILTKILFDSLEAPPLYQIYRSD